MEPRIETLPPSVFIGLSNRMSLAHDETPKLWQSFMPRKDEVKNQEGEELYSIQEYDPEYFQVFDPHAEFYKWAAVKVSDSSDLPSGMKSMSTEGGMYAVFPYKGLPSEAVDFIQRIFNMWLPVSEYELDDRPHFAVMGENYKGEDPDSEEEFWIPIRE